MQYNDKQISPPRSLPTGRQARRRNDGRETGLSFTIDDSRTESRIAAQRDRRTSLLSHKASAAEVSDTRNGE